MHLKSLIYKHIGNDFLVVAAGATCRAFRNKIVEYCIRNTPIVIGINNMTHIIEPDYHLWTNNGRLKEFGSCISDNSTVLYGCRIKEENKVDKSKTCIVQYTDNPTESDFEYRGNTIHGYFRTAGNLAIYLSYLFGARTVSCVGLDGYGLYYGGNHHCYGRGHTDNYSYEANREKDQTIYQVLNNLWDSGYMFNILTPSLYSKFVDLSVLNICE